MPPSNLAIKSYTQPSCTLQIVDHSSIRSNSGGSSTGQLQFELHFDDLRQLKGQQISIIGDRHQLALLHEAVTKYVHKLLGSSPERFNTGLSSQTNLASEAVLSSHPPDRDFANYDVPEITNYISESTKATREIFLQQGSGLSHNLFLGTLATRETGQVIELTMLQLFDLATALDEYAADVLTTPAFSRTRRAASSPSSTWASIAAMLLLGVGLTAGVVALLNRSDEAPQTAQRSVTPRSNSNQIAIAPPASLTPQLSSPDTLPSLPPVNTSKALPTASPQSGIPPTRGGLAGTTTLPLPQTIAIPTPPPVPTTKTTPISSLPGITQAPPILKPTGSQGSISIPKTDTPAIGKVTTLPTINTGTNISIPQPPKISSPPKLIDESSAAFKNRNTQITASNTQPTAQQRLKAALQGQRSDSSGLPNRSPSNPTSAGEPKTTALLSTPQSAEVKAYFVKNWEPPSNLNQTLEYSIVLDVDGSIGRIEPLGKAARTYVDRSGMPLIGEPFVSPNPQGDTPRIRVVLSPDGKVQTFVEPN